MSAPGAISFIRSLQRKWKVNTLLSYLLLSLAITVLLLFVLIRFPVIAWWWCIPVFAACFAACVLLYRSWQVSEMEVAMYLNHQYPQLEESSGLLLKPYDQLNLLEKLQVQKVSNTLQQLPVPGTFYKKLTRAALVLLAAVAVGTALFFTPIPHSILKADGNIGSKASGPKPEKLLPTIAGVRVTIVPPAYTRKGARTQSLFNLSAEQGAQVKWQISTTVPTDTMALIINGSGLIKLTPLNAGHTSWGTARSIQAPGYYQVKTGGKVSEMYTIEMIKDAPPLITIQKPASYTVIDYGQPQQLSMRVAIEDDYGIRDASISATTSTGSGEGVKFKEQTLTFPGFRTGDRKYTLEKVLDLPSLGMKPGDELYFYVKSTDVFNQESRSDVYMISLPDTAQLMSIDGLASSQDIKSEYFRSERQIILETEQLLRDQKTITADAYKTKSNDLGIDQKLLRLRYSKFLGEEEEEEEKPGEGSSDPGEFGNAEKMMAEVSHEHAVEEGTIFVEGEAAKQLRVILDEMWKAETKLRTLTPAEALPFEYKALRLLKDLQEKSRSYVAKTSVKVAPLKPEKRLTGDLSKIEQPVNKTDITLKASPEDAVRRALGILESLRATSGIAGADLDLLHQAALQLNKKASAEPTLYLASLGAMNRLLAASGNSGLPSSSDITAAQKGLQRLVKTPAALPDAGAKGPDRQLSQQYFEHLKKLDR